MQQASLSLFAVTLGAAALIPSTFATPALQVGREIDPSVAMGMTVAWPAAYLLHGELPGGDTEVSRLRLRGPGRVAGGNMPPSPINRADYRLSQVFSNHPGVQLDAISSGRAIFPGANPWTGRIDPNNTNWLTITASVNRGSTGEPGSLIRLTSNAARPNTLYGHYLDGSGLIDPYLVGATVVEAPASRTATGNLDVPDLSGLDFAIGAIAYNFNAGNPVTFPNPNQELYFSVTRDWARNYATNYTIPFAGTMSPHEGTIYRTQWTQGSGWSTPTVFIDHTELFGNAHGGEGTLEGDVDALEVDQSINTVLFSATRESGHESEIMLKSKYSTAPPTAAKDRLGEKLGKRLRIDDALDSDLDALCGTDPELNRVGLLVGYQVASGPSHGFLGSFAAENSGGISLTHVDVGPRVSTPGYYVVMSGWGAWQKQSMTTGIEYRTGTYVWGQPTNMSAWTTVWSPTYPRGLNDDLHEIFIPVAPAGNPAPGNVPQPVIQIQPVGFPDGASWPPTDMFRSPAVIIQFQSSDG